MMVCMGTFGGSGDFRLMHLQQQPTPRNASETRANQEKCTVSSRIANITMQTLKFLPTETGSYY